jgi:hypothetical protein
MAMNREFADWYRVASLAPSPELLDARWAGVEATSAALTASQIIDLVRLFVLRPHVGYKAPAFMDKAFRDEDTSFPAKGNSEELRVLAGAILRDAMDEEHAAAPAAAYGIVCAAVGNRLSDLPTNDHVTRAQRLLTELGAAVRDTEATWDKAAPITRQRLDELMPAPYFNPNQTPNLREGLLTALVEISTKANRAAASSITSLMQMVQSQREELNLLWWLQNGFSRDLAKTFTDIRIPTATIVFPLELSDLTAFVPGPPGIFGMIVSALGQVSAKEAKVSIKASVNAVSRDWRKIRIEGIASQTVGNLCPVYLAMSKSLETDGDDDWIPAFRKQSEMSAEDEIEARDLAYQVYCERMFVRALSELTK